MTIVKPGDRVRVTIEGVAGKHRQLRIGNQELDLDTVRLTGAYTGVDITVEVLPPLPAEGVTEVEDKYGQRWYLSPDNGLWYDDSAAATWEAVCRDYGPLRPVLLGDPIGGDR